MAKARPACDEVGLAHPGDPAKPLLLIALFEEASSQLTSVGVLNSTGILDASLNSRRVLTVVHEWMLGKNSSYIMSPRRHLRPSFTSVSCMEGWP